ncbi:MAG TPA: hypothetical protein VFB62_11655, partial [Polyangiaceae bacterium]|nr:hypothetical protein [Polyangiaceae bacterium]
ISLPPGSLRIPRAGSPPSLPGTLTLATGSLEAQTSRASRPMILLAALVIGCVAGVVWWELRPPVETAEPAAVPPAAEAPPTVSEEAGDKAGEEPAEEPATSEPTAEPIASATPSSTPSAKSSAPRARRARSKPAPSAPAPSVTKHPVLGI